MIVRCLLGALLALTLTAPAALAGIAPSFHGDGNAWNATDVVVVSEGNQLDGKVRVEEVLCGGCLVGTELELPGLAEFAPAERRTIDSTWREPGPITEVTGQRMLLFLVREGTSWKPAAKWGGLQVSIAWLEGGEAFGFVQIINPGPAVLVSVGTERELLARVGALRERKLELAKALLLGDPLERARALRPLLAEYVAQTEVYDALGACGEGALPVFLELLRDPARQDDGRELMAAARRACGAAIVPAFVAILEEEALFWEVEGARLQAGWWNGQGLEPGQCELLRNRYSRVHALLLALAAAPDVGCRAAVARLRRPWFDLPALNDSSGLNQMYRACDDVLAACDRLGGAPR